MAAKDGERSASSATRFTATTPHASSKMGSGAATHSRFGPAPGARGPRKPASAAGPSAGPAAGPSAGTETPEQRVARLRAAHQAAKNAKVSRFDQVLAKARPFFDSAHRITVMSLVGLTAVAGVMTAYTAYDMLRYNRQRKAEFAEIQKKMAVDSLEAARLAYMRGDASDEQISLVERANAENEGFKMPNILSAPRPIGSRRDEEAGEATVSESGAPPTEKKSSKLWGLFGSGSTEGAQDSAASASEQQPKSLEEKRAMLETARVAFEREKENQRKGGPLDRLGTEVSDANSTQPKDAGHPKKKGWLW